MNLLCFPLEIGVVTLLSFPIIVCQIEYREHIILLSSKICDWKNPTSKPNRNSLTLLHNLETITNHPESFDLLLRLAGTLDFLFLDGRGNASVVRTSKQIPVLEWLECDYLEWLSPYISSCLPSTHKKNCMPGFLVVGGSIKLNLANEALIEVIQIASESEHLTGFAVHPKVIFSLSGWLEMPQISRAPKASIPECKLLEKIFSVTCMGSKTQARNKFRARKKALVSKGTCHQAWNLTPINESSDFHTCAIVCACTPRMDIHIK